MNSLLSNTWRAPSRLAAQTGMTSMWTGQEAGGGGRAAAGRRRGVGEVAARRRRGGVGADPQRAAA
ncbi:hypothetical protein EYF80_064667 [Liparis tanakae]|uniref:Uncharacterized protein n=1 Tax=Liparis tanakae TaxID=230148 RepID=A0A4Z2E8W2_9TELE|nr:hypothetical protein EYF80_064667 [Liparis tanakae]